MFAVHHASMVEKRPGTIWVPAAYCGGLFWWFCALLVMGDKAGVEQAVTVCVGTAAALSGGLAHQRWQLKFPKP